MNTQMKTLGICVVMVGLIFITLGLYSKNQNEHLLRAGISEPGTISDARLEAGSKNKKRPILVVKWGRGSEERTDDFEVKKSFYETKVQGRGTLVNTDVTVRHIPGRPNTAIIEGGSTDFSGMQWLGYAVSLGGVCLTYRAFRKGVPSAPTA